LKHPELLKKMENANMIICNHTKTHRDMTKITSKDEFCAELKSLEEIYLNATGKEMKKFYRPPEGKFSELNLMHAKELGYKTVLWSFAYADWDNENQPTKEFAMKKILDNTHNGAIILLHPTSATNASIISELIDEWRKQGYTFASLEDL
jgi:peptidoglycan-N-acetylmuramic acid deacetylase